MHDRLKMIFSATDFEVKDALEKFEYKKVAEAPFEVWRNDTCRLIITGIGLTPAATGFAWACSEFDFEEALNVGTCGATSAVKCNLKEFSHDEPFKVISELPHERVAEVDFASAYEISRVSSIEPYSDKVFDLSPTGRTLATSSRPVSTAKRRALAGEKGDLVDMEGYAFAFAAEVFHKKISMIKLVSDFSEECDIMTNIRILSRRLSNIEGIFV